MKRSTWAAVLATAAVLIVAGNLPRIPFAALASSWGAGIERQVAAWPRLERRMSPGAPASHAVSQASLQGVELPHRRPLIAVAPARLLATVAMPQPALRGFTPPSLPELPPYVTVPALAGGFAGLLVALTLGLALRRDRRARVWQLARRGLPLTRIARTARVPQDAVRSLLTPGVGARR